MVHDDTKQKLNRYISELKTTYETVETVDKCIEKILNEIESGIGHQECW